MSAESEDYPETGRSTDHWEGAAASGPRRASDKPIADPWRDLLLTLSVQLPIEGSPEELTSSFMDHLAVMLPHLAVGACIVTEPGVAPHVERRIPPGQAGGNEPDPTRLFPRLGEERAICVEEGAGGGSTLHVAAETGALLRPLDLQIAERAALVLGAALRRARAFQRTQRSTRELERLQAHIIQAEKLASLGQIVAGVVHELNNPLTSIIAYAEYLNRKTRERLPDPSAEDDLERLRRINEAAHRILKFSRDLVAYARPSAEVPGPLQIADVIDKAAVFCEHEFAVWSIRLERDLTPELPAVRGVTGQLTQVFVNLFTNAAHAMSAEGGVLTVRAEVAREKNAIVVAVEDQGSGIEPSSLPHIFEPFFTTKTDGRGTGLGLSIVRDIIDGHGGTVRVQSEAGRGTVFTLTLPLAATVSTLPPR